MQPFLDAIWTFDNGDMVVWLGLILGVALAALMVTRRADRRVKVVAQRPAPMVLMVPTTPAPPYHPDQSWQRVADIVDGGVVDADVVAAAHLGAGRQIDAAGYALGRLKADCTQVMLAGALPHDPVLGVAPALLEPPVAA
jgi:hypothetical protein